MTQDQIAAWIMAMQQCVTDIIPMSQADFRRHNWWCPAARLALLR